MLKIWGLSDTSLEARVAEVRLSVPGIVDDVTRFQALNAQTLHDQALDDQLLPAVQLEAAVLPRIDPSRSTAAVLRRFPAGRLATEQGELAIQPWQEILASCPQFGGASVPLSESLFQFAREWLPDAGVSAVKPLATGKGSFKGMAGQPVFMVSDDRGALLAVVKLFPQQRSEPSFVDAKHVEEAGREYSAQAHLSGYRLQHMRTVSPMGLAQVGLEGGDRRAVALMMESAQGSGMDDHIEQFVTTQSPSAWRVLEEAVREIGLGLSEMHTTLPRSGHPVGRQYIERHLKVCQQVHALIDARWPITDSSTWSRRNLGVPSLQLALDRVYQDALDSPGPGVVAHGDPNPGNNMYAKASRELWAIDLSNCHHSFDHQGRGIGSAARDVGQFSKMWEVAAQEGGLSEDETGKLRRLFLNTYWTSREAADPGAAKQEAKAFKFFEIRAGLRTVLNAINTFVGSGENPDYLSLLEYRIGLLCDALLDHNSFPFTLR